MLASQHTPQRRPPFAFLQGSGPTFGYPESAEMTDPADRRKYELATARNEAEAMCHQLEKTMEEHASKLSDSDKAPMEAAIAKVKEAAEGEDPDAIKSAVKELEQASHAFSKAMYESADSSAAPETTDATAESSADDEAIDAEFEVKND